MNWLKPKVIASQARQVAQIPTLRGVVQISESAALGHLVARGINIQGIDLIEVDVAGILWRNYNCVIPAPRRSVIVPSATSDEPVACTEAVSSRLLCI